MKRYFVAHANVRNAIKLAPIAIQTHTDMKSPCPPFPYQTIKLALRFPSARRFAGICGFGLTKL
jgi:hypothetical protein